jgi:hypothetical protein
LGKGDDERRLTREKRFNEKSSKVANLAHLGDALAPDFFYGGSWKLVMDGG